MIQELMVGQTIQELIMGQTIQKLMVGQTIQKIIYDPIQEFMGETNSGAYGRVIFKIQELMVQFRSLWIRFRILWKKATHRVGYPD